MMQKIMNLMYFRIATTPFLEWRNRHGETPQRESYPTGILRRYYTKKEDVRYCFHPLFFCDCYAAVLFIFILSPSQLGAERITVNALVAGIHRRAVVFCRDLFNDRKHRIRLRAAAAAHIDDQLPVLGNDRRADKALRLTVRRHRPPHRFIEQRREHRTDIGIGNGQALKSARSPNCSALSRSPNSSASNASSSENTVSVSETSSLVNSSMYALRLFASPSA